MKTNFFYYFIALVLIVLLPSCKEGFSVNQAPTPTSSPNPNPTPTPTPSPSGPVITFTSWLKQLGATTKAYVGADNSGSDLCYATTTDQSGNVYCAGHTTSSLGEANGGGYDAFVMKMNSAGEILWAKQLGSASEVSSTFVNSTAGNDGCTSVAVDANGQVYCGGYTTGALSEPNGGNKDAFIMKLNSDGDILWIKQLGLTTQGSSSLVINTSGNDVCQGVGVDSFGSVYCAGSTNAALGEANDGSYDAFILKLDSSSNVVWLKQLGTATAGSAHVTSSAGNDYCESLAVSHDDFIFCAGSTTGNLNETNGGGYDAFVMKVDINGNIRWIRQLGNSTEGTSIHVNDTTGSDMCLGLAVDNDGNSYCAGQTNGSLAENIGGALDAFIVKINPIGSIEWVTQLGADTEASSPHVSDTSGSNLCWSIAVDQLGDVYCAGETDRFTETPGPWSWDSFALKLSTSGEIQWLKHFASVTISTPGYNASVGRGIAVDTNGSIYVGGESYGNLSETEGGGGNSDAFIMKLKPDGSLDL